MTGLVRMSVSISRIFVSTACLAALFVFGNVNAAKPAVADKSTAAKPVPAEPLKFAKGSDTATVKGSFKGGKGHVRDFTVPMQAGQTLEVALVDKAGMVYSYIYRPGAAQVEGEGRKKWKVQPTVEGNYVVHVYLTQSAVDKKESASWELTVTRK